MLYSHLLQATDVCGTYRVEVPKHASNAAIPFRLRSAEHRDAHAQPRGGVSAAPGRAAPGHADRRRIPSAAVGAATGPRRGHAPEGARGTAGTGAQRSVPAVPTPVSLFQGKAAGKESAEPGAAAGPVVAAGDGGVRVSVRAKPGSRCSAVTGGRRAGRAQRGRGGAVRHCCRPEERVGQSRALTLPFL